MPQLLAALERAAHRRRSRLLIGFTALVLLAVGAAAVRWQSAPGARAATSAGATAVTAPIAPSTAAVTSSAAATSSDKVAVNAPPGGSVRASPRGAAPLGAPSEKSRAPKPTDVRYKDWLKDPF